jgi:trehalose/maltose transport system substrate-binding protein
MTKRWSSRTAITMCGLCVATVLLASCSPRAEPVSLNFPHGWSFRPDDLATRAALSEQFTRETGIEVRDIPVPESTFEQLVLFRTLLQQGSSGLDLFAIDTIWTQLLEGDLIDLRAYSGDEIALVKPQLLPSYTVEGKVLAIPFEVNIGSLEYRADLLREYGYDHPPATWDELEAMAKRIQAGERAKGKSDFWGFVWQGAEAEALTCNALEWQVAEGGGRIVESDRTISVNNPAAIRAWQRARRWIGTISPPAVVAYRERDSMNVFDAGRAAFNRLWLGTSDARSGAFSQVHWRSLEPQVRTGFTSIPGGPGGWAGTLGGSGLSVSRRSIHPQEAVKLVRFLIHAQIDSIAKRTTVSPNQPEFFNVPVSDHSGDSIEGTRVVHRPSIETGSKYPQVSAAYVAAVHGVLTGEQTAPEAAAELEKQLMEITGYRRGVPRTPK